MMLAFATLAPIVATAQAAPAELATALGTVAIADAAPGQRSPACAELVVEARGALDNHLIGITHPALDRDGACRYELTVPAQTAVWLRVRPELVAGARVTTMSAYAPPLRSSRTSSASVQLRWRTIAPQTYFLAPGERKIAALAY